MRNRLVVAGFVLLVSMLPVAANAAANPSGTGQPSQSCGSATAPSNPAGFDTSGFVNAESHYAGSQGTPSLQHSNSTAAVSQYDVACFQVSQH
ncbi:MAG: hypothetical protein QOH48_501 [Actinomycetota bacterium]|jgi:hypothetical protein|nr:hypothetical protein [Actinomycetota bacterium]